MYCINCGTKNEDDSKFCINCGEKMEEEQTTDKKVEEAQEVVDKVKAYADSKNYKYNDIDGVRVNFDDGWALVRYSNTGPNITARFEANNEERLQALQDEFVGKINEYNN